MVKLRAKLARVTRDAVHSASLVAVELAGSASVLAGIGHYSRPCAFIVGGIAAIYAVERQPKTRAEVAAEIEKTLSALNRHAGAGRPS